MAKESALQTWARDWLNAQEGTFAVIHHGNQFSYRGYPDISFVYHGQAYFIETKSAGKEPSEAQKQCHAKLRASGARVFVCSKREQVETAFTLARIRHSAIAGCPTCRAMARQTAPDAREPAEEPGTATVAYAVAFGPTIARRVADT